ncbi:MAG: hypothetical protein U9Q33_01630 [Campylobacterota bacterium]|nr:hypothetical protein [Campylobacterota bacterium]
MNLFIFDNQGFSTFNNYIANTEENEINQLILSIKAVIAPVNMEIETNNQFIATESDLKCLIYNKILPLYQHYNINIGTELADKIIIDNDYCINTDHPQNSLIMQDDIIRQTTTTRMTDMTITLNPEFTYIERNIQKGFTLNGNHIDIEFKFIRKGFNNNELKTIRKDFCKLKYLVDRNPDTVHSNRNHHGIVHFGLFIIGFAKLNTLESYLNNTEFTNYLNNFNNLPNIATLLIYRDT